MQQAIVLASVLNNVSTVSRAHDVVVEDVVEEVLVGGVGVLVDIDLLCDIQDGLLLLVTRLCVVHLIKQI